MERIKYMSRILTCGICLSILTFAVTGCQDEECNTAACTQHLSEQKPVVSLVPVIDSTQNAYPWNLSDELTSQLYCALSQNNRFYLTDLTQIRTKTKQLNELQNPFGTEVGWIKKTFHGDEFVAFFELIQHEEVLRQDRRHTIDSKSCAADLNMSMRVRVFDLRGRETKVILQELICFNHFVPRAYTKQNFSQVSWKEEEFPFSPLGIAHGDFIKEIASRLEEYVLFSHVHAH